MPVHQGLLLSVAEAFLKGFGDDTKYLKPKGPALVNTALGWIHLGEQGGLFLAIIPGVLALLLAGKGAWLLLASTPAQLCTVSVNEAIVTRAPEVSRAFSLLQGNGSLTSAQLPCASHCPRMQGVDSHAAIHWKGAQSRTALSEQSAHLTLGEKPGESPSQSRRLDLVTQPASHPARESHSPLRQRARETSAKGP